MARIVVLDNIADEGIEILESAEGIEYEVHTGLKGEELRKTLNEFDGAILRSGVKITAESLEGNKRLRAIVRAGVGTDNIDKAAATRLGIVVMNTPDGNTVSTAEHTFALLLALSRNIAPANQSLVEGRWDRKKYMGTQLAGKKLGVIGMGRIGREVASRAQAFHMEIVGYDPFLTDEQADKLGIEKANSIEDLLALVDYLTVHTPKTPETTGLVNKGNLDRLKDGIRLVNAARGGIYEEDALVEGLKSGKIAGVALDVYDPEPCTDSPLFGMEGTVCTPHLGASTSEAQTQVAVEGIHLLINYLTKGEIQNAVNVASLDRKTLVDLRGYLDVAYRLGMLLSQWHGGGVDSVKMHYRGRIADKDTRLVTNAFCAGLLERAMDDDVNIINAEMLLRERSIELTTERNSEIGAFASSISAEVGGNGRTVHAAGTLLGNNMPRLVQVGDHRLEAFLDGNMLIFTHEDVPGIIGRVGTIFGEHNVNIAQMAVGRSGSSAGGPATGVLNLDEVPTEAARKAVESMEEIHDICVAKLPTAGDLPSWLR